MTPSHTPTSTPTNTPTPTGLPHAADTDGNWRITIGEAAAALQCWLNDDCSIGEAAKALDIWLKGECYERGDDDEFVYPIECPQDKYGYMRSPAILSDQEYLAERILPAGYVPEVTLLQ